MQKVAPNNSYDHLTAAQKLEVVMYCFHVIYAHEFLQVFEYALSCTTGDDLAMILWYQSVSSEAWLSRRTHFTRSLAVMSVVGYILGLGDRHPSNLMLNRKTGKIIHIDFGDCFEVAMHREKFPEKVPFRLTRMLVQAMEVSGVEGTFRLTCQAVMSVLRTHGDSLMAILEAFIHDPLISWRLLGKKG
jgi:FKBP12-rapamycin complex-associated protein